MWTCPKCSKKVDDAYEICWACGTTVDGIEDPHFLDEAISEERVAVQSEEGAPTEDLATVAKCIKVAEAHAMRVRLESEGIPVILFDELSATTMFGFQGSALVKVQVPEPYLQQARDILGILKEEEEGKNEDELENDEDMDEDQEDNEIPGEEGIIDKERLGELPLDQGITDKPNEQ